METRDRLTRLVSKLGVDISVRPAVSGRKLDLEIVQLKVGGMPFPPKWLLHVLRAGLREGTPVELDTAGGVIVVDLDQILPDGMVISSLSLENGSLRIGLTGG